MGRAPPVVAPHASVVAVELYAAKPPNTLATLPYTTNTIAKTGVAARSLCIDHLVSLSGEGRGSAVPKIAVRGWGRRLRFRGGVQPKAEALP